MKGSQIWLELLQTFPKYIVTNSDGTNDTLNYALCKYITRKIFFAWKYLKMSSCNIMS